jgi:hypothetical protein
MVPMFIVFEAGTVFVALEFQFTKFSTQVSVHSVFCYQFKFCSAPHRTVFSTPLLPASQTIRADDLIAIHALARLFDHIETCLADEFAVSMILVDRWDGLVRFEFIGSLHICHTQI